MEDDWQALKDPLRSPRFTTAEKAALAYAEKATRGSANTAGAEVEAMKPHFNEPQMVDIVATVALANLTNRVTGPLELELEFAPQKI